MIPYLLLTCFLMIVFVTDVTKTVIPNRYTIPFTLIGIVYYTLMDGWSGLLFSIAGCIGGLGLLVLLYLFRAVGAGDVKLFAAIGALTGTSFMLYTLMYAILYSGLIGIVVILARRSVIQKLKEKLFAGYAATRATHFPFMLAVLPGAATAYAMILI